MSQNILQIYTASPATNMVSTDLLYLGRSPYGTGDDFAITWANMQASITALGTITSGIWNGGIITGTYGGTGVNNGARTITIGGNVAFSGAYTFTGTLTGNTAVTFPTSGTLATTSAIPSFPLSLANGGTNANLTASNGGIFYSTASAGAILAGTATSSQVLLSGSSTTPAWSTATYPATTTINQLLYSSAANAVTGLATATTAVLTTAAGVPTWAAELSLALGGTNAALTASNGGIFYSTASAGAILAGTATAGQLLTSGANTTPAWTTSTYPATNAVSTLLYASSANVMAALATANNGVLVTSAGGVPSISSTLPAAVVANIPGRLVSRTIYTYTDGGSHTYTVPAGVTSLLVEVVGPGGGGGGSTTGAGTVSAAGGGAGGGYGRIWLTGLAASYSYIIQAAGAGGALGGGTGGTGGQSSFNGAFGNCYATGGSGGIGAGGTSNATVSMTFGGAGGDTPGIGNGGDINAPGGEGMFGWTQGSTEYAGAGGTSYWDGGAPAPGTNSANNGTIGGGGSGAAGPNSVAGGTGGNGLIYVWEFA